MVVNKWKSRANFALFLLPALGFYLIFAIYPLAQGLWLSMTNWDGTAPWTPAQVKIDDFQTRVLDKLSPSDKALVLKYYEKDEDAGTYQKRELYGFDKYRLMAIFNRVGMDNPDFKFVGLANYIDILSGKLDPRFFPQSYTDSRFQSGSPVEGAEKIPRSEWEGNLVPHIKSATDRAFLESRYTRSGDFYVLNTAQFPTSELDLQLGFAQTPGLEDDWEALYSKLQDIGGLPPAVDTQAIDALMKDPASLGSAKVSAADLQNLHNLAQQVVDVSRLKRVLAENWYEKKTKMGVLVFTAFFTVMNVILLNGLAIILALALDTKIRNRNFLRSVFFVPNVLSMVIVAFIWQLVFRQLLPAITGISTWVMNPDLAPWLTVMVATWQGLGYYTVIYLAGLQNVPQEITEVASIDGANAIQKFFRIILPLLWPAITICLFLSIAGALKTFDIIFALYPSNSTAVGVDNIVINIFYDAFRDKHAGAATAKAVMLLILILIITGIQMTLTKRKEIEY